MKPYQQDHGDKGNISSGELHVKLLMLVSSGSSNTAGQLIYLR